ncbi:hypothetical protein CB1_000961020 [Camelus ferus]|nr:hypothetical protein CB1_000961020 [Camelus ferus]
MRGSPDGAPTPSLMLAGNIGSLSAADTETKNVTYCGCHLQPQEPYYPYYGQGFQQKYKNVSRQEEAEGELSEGEHWYGNSSETPSEASYGEVQENYKLSLEDRIQEQSTSPDTSLGSATPSSHTLELVALDGEVLRDPLHCQDHLSPGASSLCDEDPPGSAKPLSSNLRRLLEAGSLKLDAPATANGRVESPVNAGSNLSFSPPSHHAQQLSVLARKLAEKQEQNDQYTPSNRFIWNQGKWLPNSTTTCGLSPDSAILKLKAAANAVLQDKSLTRTEETMRFESFSSPFSSQSASSTLAALSKKVSERSLTPGQEHPPPASSFLSLASMTSSAALLKEVAARAAGTLLAEKSSLVPEDPLPPPPSEKKQEKVHQHQDRGETFQCQLCPFTSSRHFSLKLHMRCHQHFLRTEAKVKEEIPDPDVKGSPHLSDSACLGQQREGGGTELVGTMMTSSTPERTSQGGAGVSPLLVKEEPKEDNGLPTSFTLNATDRPANHTKLRDPSEYVANSASALFSQDISVKMASDFLMKLSAANQKEPMNLNFKVKEEPKEEEALGATLPRSSYVFSPESDVPAPSISEDALKPQEAKGNVLRRDMSVKAASELLMKLSAESYKDTQMVKIKEEPMEVDIQDSHASISPSRNVGYSTLIGREKTEPLQKLPEGRVPPERNLFSQDISVKMASELLFQLSEKVSKEHNHTKENTVRTTTRVERPSRMLQQAKAIRVSLVLPTAATGQRALPPCREDRVPLCSARLGRSPLSLFMNKVRFLREIQVFPRADISRVRTCRFTSVACAWLWLPGPGLPASAAPTRPGTVLPVLRSFLAPRWMNGPRQGLAQCSLS